MTEREHIIEWLSKEVAALRVAVNRMDRDEALVAEAIADSMDAVVRRIEAGEHLK